MDLNSIPAGLSTPTPDVGDLFTDAYEYGDISDASLQTLSVADLGAQIQAGLGVAALDVPASRAVLLTMLLDDSGSIQYRGNEQAVRDGYNQVLKALLQSKQQDEILAQTRYINGRILYPYRFLSHAPMLDKSNFTANGMTPLYDQAIVTLGSVLAKTTEFERNGQQVNTVTLIVTDGCDAGSSYTARNVYPLVTDMLARENHIIAGMGIDDGETDFRQVFRDMGIPDNWVLTPKNDQQEIRRAFQLFSQSAVVAAQGTVNLNAGGSAGFPVSGFTI